MDSASKNHNIEKTQKSFRHWLLRNVTVPIGDYLLGQKMIQRLAFLEKAQWWDAERLNSYRNNSLITLLNIAYQEVPFYRKLMDKAHVEPADISNPADLKRLPIVTKEMLRASYPHLTTRKTGQRTREYYTSGSTGKNFCVKYDYETLGWLRASFLLAAEWAGWVMGEPYVQTGMTLERGWAKWFKDFLFSCHYVSAFDLTDSHLDTTLDFMEKNKIRYLWGYPGSIYFLARRAIRRGWNQSLRSLMTWGDNLYPQYRKTIEQAFKARVFDAYGCGEGIQVSAQCGHMNTYHIHTLDVVVESVDDEGNAVLPKKPGNLILTRLHPGPMPLIRYKVGDIGILGEKRTCACGRGFEVMESIQGRDTDIVITPSGNRLIVHFFTGILEHFPEIDSFQVVQENLDTIILRIVPTRDFSREIEAKAISKLKKKGASDMKIIVEEVENIPLSPSEKRQFVISKFGKSFKAEEHH